MSLKDVYNYASEAWDYRNGKSYNLDSWSEYKNEKAFEKGVESASEKPVIYVDPDLLPLKEFREAGANSDIKAAIDIAKEAGALLMEQLEAQQPGAMDAVADRYDMGALGERGHSLIFASITKGSPAAVHDIMIGDTEYCLVYKPSDEWDSKEELINNFINNEEIARSVFENTSVDGSALSYAVGRHEGIHCNRPGGDSKSELEVLREEIRADKLGYFSGGVESNTALLMKDMRHLAETGDHAGHSTGALLVSGEEATEAHIAAAAGYKYKMDILVVANNEDVLSMEESEQLLQNDPEAYFSAVHEEIDLYKARITEFYHDNPEDFMTQEMVVGVEAKIDYMNNYEAAYRRQVLQQDVAEPEPTRILSDEDRQSYLEERKAVYEDGEMVELEVPHSENHDSAPLQDFDPYRTEIPSAIFSGSDAAYSGDIELLKEASAAGLDVHPDLMPEPLSPEEPQPAPSSPQQLQTLSI